MPAAQWTEGYLNVNNVSIHYYESLPINSSSLISLPILLCLHGIMNRGADLMNSTYAFTPYFKVVIPDLRAHDKSKPIPFGTFTMDWLASDQVGLIEKLFSGRAVYIYGCSLGAAVAARAINMNPTIFSGAVLEDPPWTYFPGEIPGYREEKNSFHLNDAQIQLLLQISNLTDVEFRILWGEAVGNPDIIITDSMIADYRVFDIANAYSTINLLSEQSNMASLNISIPTALQFGDTLDGAVLSLHFAEGVLTTYTQGTVQYFPGGTHTLHTGTTGYQWQQRTLSFLSFISRSQASFR